MRAVLRRLGTALLFAAIAACFAPTLVPPFMDRIYYRGPASDHFDGARFRNLEPDPPRRPRPGGFMRRMLTSDARARWPESVPVTPTVPPPRVQGDEMRVTWIGHATVLVQTAGLNILTDPIWSARASPFSFAGPRRVRAPGVRFDDLPPIDLVLVSHNHYDHLDLATLRRLWERDRPTIVTSLGNDTILRRAGIPQVPQSTHCAGCRGVVALDWGGFTPAFGAGYSAWERGEGGAVAPAAFVFVNRNHHWSSRWFVDRNRALWSGFTILTPSGSIFYAGDTGWGGGGWVREVARRGPFRLAIIPIGAYEPRDFMRANHINPAEAVAMFEILRPERAIGVHWGTFQLSFEEIDAPRRELAARLSARNIAPDRFVTVEAGESLDVPRAVSR